MRTRCATKRGAPGHCEITEGTAPTIPRVAAVEASAALNFVKCSDKVLRERHALRAEQVGAQCSVLQPHARPASDVGSTVELNKWSKHWPEHDKLIDDTWEKLQVVPTSSS